MRMRDRQSRVGLVIVGKTAALALPASAQQGIPSPRPVGAGLPPTLKLKELTSEWRYVGIQPVGRRTNPAIC